MSLDKRVADAFHEPELRDAAGEENRKRNEDIRRHFWVVSAAPFACKRNHHSVSFPPIPGSGRYRSMRSPKTFTSDSFKVRVWATILFSVGLLGFSSDDLLLNL